MSEYTATVRGLTERGKAWLSEIQHGDDPAALLAWAEDLVNTAGERTTTTLRSVTAGLVAIGEWSDGQIQWRRIPPDLAARLAQLAARRSALGTN